MVPTDSPLPPHQLRMKSPLLCTPHVAIWPPAPSSPSSICSPFQKQSPQGQFLIEHPDSRVSQEEGSRVQSSSLNEAGREGWTAVKPQEFHAERVRRGGLSTARPEVQELVTGLAFSMLPAAKCRRASRRRHCHLLRSPFPGEVAWAPLGLPSEDTGKEALRMQRPQDIPRAQRALQARLRHGNDSSTLRLGGEGSTVMPRA